MPSRDWLLIIYQELYWVLGYRQKRFYNGSYAIHTGNSVKSTQLPSLKEPKIKAFEIIDKILRKECKDGKCLIKDFCRNYLRQKRHKCQHIIDINY